MLLSEGENGGRHGLTAVNETSWSAQAGLTLALLGLYHLRAAQGSWNVNGKTNQHSMVLHGLVQPNVPVQTPV